MPVIFAANHASHLDTPLLLTTLPARFRHRTVVAAAADYFFDRRWKAVLWSFTLAAIPIERARVNRRSAEVASDLLGDNWNLVIFPEGGRTPDGWAQEFRGGAAYLALRTGAPVIPVYLHGTRHILPKRDDAPGSGPRAAPAGRGDLRPAPLARRRRGRPPLRCPHRAAVEPWPAKWTPTGGRPAADRDRTTERCTAPRRCRGDGRGHSALPRSERPSRGSEATGQAHRTAAPLLPRGRLDHGSEP